MVGSRLGAILGCALFAACGSVSNDDPDARPGNDGPPAGTVQLTTTASGPGSVQVAPLGTPCGTGCFLYPPGTSVTLTPAPLVGARVTGWTAPCGSTPGDNACTFIVTASLAVETSFECTADYVVDAATGDDTATGACGDAFKTITHAVTVAAAGQTIRVAPGLYDGANGEVFPIIFSGVSVIGNEADKGATTIVQGPTNLNGFQPRGTATLAGLTVKGASRGVYLDDQATTVTVRNNTFTECSGAGFWANGPGGPHTVVGNVSFLNGFHGFAHIQGNPAVRYEGNRAYQNAIGIELNTSGADLGGGAQSSPGGNHFTCNTTNDLYLLSPVQVSARNNSYDHAPAQVGAFGGGVDIYLSGTTTVNQTGASVTTSPCNP